MIDLSVCITTYNLAKVIDQALESVFSQITNYSFEVLIGDDGSSDQTIDVINNWIKKYPSNIKLYVMSHSAEEKENHIMRASANRINLMKYTQGKYITFLDGDDFYIDNNKFQRQIEALEIHKTCSFCAHNMNLYYEKSGIVKPICNIKKEKIINAKLYWATGMYIHAEACIIRNDFYRGDRIEHYFDDNIIVYLALQRGDCYYIPDIMLNYRQNENGYASWNETEKQLLNLMDYDMELKISPSWKFISLARHYDEYRKVYKKRKKNLDKDYPELYAQCIQDEAISVQTIMDGKTEGKSDYLLSETFHIIWTILIFLRKKFFV